MAEAIILQGSSFSSGGSSSDCTAVTSDVLEKKTAITSDSEDAPIEGTMPHLSNRSSIDVSSDNSASVLLGESVTIGENTDGTSRVCIKYNGLSGYITKGTNIGVPYDVVSKGIELTEDKIMAGQTVLGVSGTATSDANLSANYVLTGYSGYSKGAKVTGTMKNITASSTINWATGNSTKVVLGDDSFMSTNTDGVLRIGIRYNGTNGYITGNTLVSDTASSVASAGGLTAAKIAKNQSAFGISGTYTSDATAVAGNIISGKTAYVNGSKLTGTLAVQSAINFSAATLSATSIRISWKNPSKGPWSGVFIQMSTSGYPGTSGGTRKYTGTGSSSAASATSYVDITGLNSNTTYYFTCTSYCDPLAWGSSYNVSAKTSVFTMQWFLDQCATYAGGTVLSMCQKAHNNNNPNFQTSCIRQSTSETSIPSYSTSFNGIVVFDDYLQVSSGNTLYFFTQNRQNLTSSINDYIKGGATPLTFIIYLSYNAASATWKDNLINTLKNALLNTQITIDSTGYHTNNYVDHITGTITYIGEGDANSSYNTNFPSWGAVVRQMVNDGLVFSASTTQSGVRGTFEELFRNVNGKYVEIRTSITTELPWAWSAKLTFNPK